jgi:Fur family peroxide stress response transcriptional regulator
MEKKLRHSQQRDMIYNYLVSTKEHPSAEMIYEALKKDAPNLSLGTVYRNLKLLEELGLVKKVTSLNNVERYDAWCEDHVHFICNECGAVLDLPEFDDSIIKKSIKKNNISIKWMNLILGGTCDKCSKN